MHLFPVSPIYKKRPEALSGFERKNIRKAIDMILFLLMMHWLIILYHEFFFVSRPCLMK
jgi:hypothetical protein